MRYWDTKKAAAYRIAKDAMESMPNPALLARLKKLKADDPGMFAMVPQECDNAASPSLPAFKALLASV